jgi:hypothetical protein
VTAASPPGTFDASASAEPAIRFDRVKIIAWIAAVILPWSAIVWLFLTFFG